jgi:hypothetical protein
MIAETKRTSDILWMKFVLFWGFALILLNDDGVVAFRFGELPSTTKSEITYIRQIYMSLHSENEVPEQQPLQPTLAGRRRDFLSALAGISVGLVPALPSNGGEVGAKITKAVTQSDLGISVRTQVVKGAQVMDKIDGQWEQFSDRFQLGSERAKQPGKPNPKEIPDPLPLDVQTAKVILNIADEVFLSLMPMIKSAALQEKIDKLAELVKPSFLRSKAKLDLGDNIHDIRNADQFNFASYVHFKAYSDLIIQQGKGFDFNSFRRNFELKVGQRLISLLLHVPQEQKTTTKTEHLLDAKLAQLDQLCDVLKAKGLVSLTERSSLENDQLTDWLDDMSELSFTIALDGDITLGSQMLLQEQGFRLYPDYARFAVSSLLQNIESQEVSVEDYYFDTDYNSDPDKFEVKEVVLNVVLDSKE